MLRTIEAKNGRTMYYADNKLVSKDKYDELSGPQTIDQPSTTVITKTCLFCGEPATHERLVQLKTINLCESDYINKTTGEIGEKLTND